MPSNEAAARGVTAGVPSMLDLVRLSPRRIFPPGGVELYRQVALLTGMSPKLDVLSVACGKGVPLTYFVTEHGVTASGVDVDPRMVEAAERWARKQGLGQSLQFQTGRSDSLPYRDAIFDVTLGEVGLGNHCEPEDAVRELVRVTKPGGFVVLVQLSWRAPVDDARRQALTARLGVRPLMLVEWKHLLRESGVEEVHTEDWSDDGTSMRQTAVKPFPGLTETFSVIERLGIVRRAWKRWGWKGVRTLLAREGQVRRLVTGERILGLDLLRGTKAVTAHAGAERGGATSRDTRRTSRGAGAGGDEPPASVAALPHPAEAGDAESRRDGDGPDTRGLPLFRRHESRSEDVDR